MMKITDPRAPIALLIITAVVLALVVVASMYGRSWLNRAESNKATAEDRGMIAETTSAVAADVSTESADKAATDKTIIDGRSNYENQKQNLRRDNPAVVDWADRPIPDSVRQLAKARRLARDRSGTTAAGSGDIH